MAVTKSGHVMRSRKEAQRLCVAITAERKRGASLKEACEAHSVKHQTYYQWMQRGMGKKKYTKRGETPVQVVQYQVEAPTPRQLMLEMLAGQIQQAGKMLDRIIQGERNV